MLTNIGFASVTEVLPFIIIPVVFAVILIIAITTAVKRAKAEKSKQSDNKQTKYTDGNGRTQHQRDYLNGLRVRQAEKIISADGSHSHSGKEERYDPIVGSLGEVDDEGCDELDGVRLIEHDESYCDDPEHLAQTDYSALEQSIVLGEVINAPRFKRPYGKR